MWTVRDGRLVFVPQTKHVRTALGISSRVPDTLTYIRREVQDDRR